MILFQTFSSLKSSEMYQRFLYGWWEQGHNPGEIEGRAIYHKKIRIKEKKKQIKPEKLE